MNRKKIEKKIDHEKEKLLPELDDNVYNNCQFKISTEKKIFKKIIKQK